MEKRLKATAEFKDRLYLNGYIITQTMYLDDQYVAISFKKTQGHWSGTIYISPDGDLHEHHTGGLPAFRITPA